MSEPVLPYSSADRRGLTARDVFGVIVRTLGLLLIAWGAYCLVYLLNVGLTGAPSGGQPVASFVVVSGVFLAVGVLLLRGEWVVRFAYGPERD